MTPAVRALVADNLGLVHFHARRFARDGYERDVLGWGVIGLIQAAERFDGSAPFSHFASHRIRGAMVDGTRRELGDQRWAGRRGTFVRALEDVDPGDEGQVLADQNEAPDARAERRDLAAFVRAAMEHLPERERALVEAVYFGEQTLTEAGRAVGISRSRACRVHAQALGRLRARLGEVVR